MPTYDYECPNCRKKFEIFQSMNDEHIKVCPDCGKSGFKRLIGKGAGIIFKGDGFYCTDYRSSNYEKDRQKDLTAAGKCDKCPQKDSSCSQKTTQ